MINEKAKKTLSTAAIGTLMRKHGFFLENDSWI
jgi:hypothetical protein